MFSINCLAGFEPQPAESRFLGPKAPCMFSKSSSLDLPSHRPWKSASFSGNYIIFQPLSGRVYINLPEGIYILMLIPWSSDLPNDIPSALWPVHLAAFAPFAPFSARCGGCKTPDVAAQVRSLGGMPGYTEQIWWFSYTCYGGTPKSSIDIWDFAPSSYWGSSILGNLYIMVFLSHGHPQVTRGFNTNVV
jgi:hypothetical protein